jgi:hypothetical protein
MYILVLIFLPSQRKVLLEIKPNGTQAGKKLINHLKL